jgi:lipid-A-disaccharide synthase
MAPHASSRRPNPLRIAIVVSEPSGDHLGARLIRAIRSRHPEAHFEGVGGPQMLEAGCVSLVPMERLSVMGLVEILRHLPELLALRRRLVTHIRAYQPRVFVGVDAPAFNVGLSARLRRFGIRTVQYVSPTVWAWRPGRVKGLRKAVDLVLSIYPFEEEFLRDHGVPVTYVGHPLSTEITLEPDRQGARRRLGLALEERVLALLPGSRVGEVQRLAPAFLAAASRVRVRHPNLRLLSPMVNDKVHELFERNRRTLTPDLPVTLVERNSRDVLAAADLVLTASGTATLEALLHKRPMVVGYRVNPLTYALAKHMKLLKVPHVAMSNILTGDPLAPELIQDACVPEALAQALLDFLADPARMAAVSERYRRVHAQLLARTATPAAEAVLALAGVQAGGPEPGG